MRLGGVAGWMPGGGAGCGPRSFVTAQTAHALSSYVHACLLPVSALAPIPTHETPCDVMPCRTASFDYIKLRLTLSMPI